MTKEGLRVLAVASRRDKIAGEQIDEQRDLQGLTFVGLVGLQDPLRPRAADTIEKLDRAGIAVTLVTGDHTQTACAIARGAGIVTNGERVLTGLELDRMSDEQLYDCLIQND